MGNSIKKIIKAVISKCLRKKYIIFESVPDLSDNTKSVFDYMIKEKIYKKFKFVWLVSDSSKNFPPYKNTIYVDDVKDSKKLLYYKLRAKAIIFCNTLIKKENPDTLSFYLTHATQIKDSSSYYNAPKDVDYCFVTSKEFVDLMSNVYGIEQEKMLPFGFPRNDVLYCSKLNLSRFFNGDFDKVIVWYPTFRQSKGGRVVENCQCLPIIHNEEQAKIINDYLKKINTLVVLKPHFAQDLKYLKNTNLSNIAFIDDDFFVKNNITSYEFVASCDALLTDYSSIYFDYLACNKPIGVVWEDIEFYKKNRGFCLDIDYYLKGAVKIYNANDFISFVNDITKGNDILRAERMEIRKLSDDYCDGKNTQRVSEFIIEKLFND